VSAEVWKPCPGYEGVYTVSSEGRVQRVAAIQGSRVGRIMAGLLDGRGYPNVVLRVNGVPKTEKVHRLVCLAFHGQPPEGHSDVNHKDGVKHNNRAQNLEWSTRSENIKHAHRIGLVNMTNRRGAAHPKARAVLRVSPSGEVQRFETLVDACAATTNCRSDRIWMVLNGHLKTHAGYHWRNP
jgi:hypothetical protein